ncbi:site-2 protease family protein [Candidatus Babeliales bacterium]|nr:site-2 protease family protein [Candidatus Babeliales bacterium]
MVTPYFLGLINELALLFPVFLLVFTFRGFFKALIAYWMGDNTPKRHGFLSLNPLVHLDIVGLSIFIIFFFLIGSLLTGTIPRQLLLFMLLALGVRWTIHVPIDDSNFKHYKLGGIMTCLAGSIGNFLLAFCVFLLFRFVPFSSLPPYVALTLLEIFKGVIDIAIWFGVLDLVPIPPFDAGYILHYCLPYNKRYIVAWLEEYSLIIVMVLFLMPVVSDLWWGVLAMASSTIKQLMFRMLF